MRRESDTLQPGAKAPEFTLADIGGVSHNLAELLAAAGTPVPPDDRRGPATLLLVFDRGTW